MMYDLFISGGPLFMGILTLVMLLVIVQTVRARITFSTGRNIEDSRIELDYVRSLGFLGFVIGILGSLIGMNQAFTSIQEMGGEVSPALLMAGLNISMITTMYGTVILIISMILWLILHGMLKRNTE